MERISLMTYKLKALYNKAFDSTLIQNRNFLFKCPRWSIKALTIQAKAWI